VKLAWIEEPSMENPFRQPVQVRWADLDPNGHVRHSVYYDWGASARIAFLSAHGLSVEQMAEMGFGPVLLREEAIFRREVRYGDELWVGLLLSKARADGARFSFRHDIVRSDGTLCAVITVDGAWIDLRQRKLTAPPEVVVEMFDGCPKAHDFTFL
jgi:acyl-CoA thioester hydrolase